MINVVEHGPGGFKVLPLPSKISYSGRYEHFAKLNHDTLLNVQFLEEVIKDLIPWQFKKPL